MAEHGAEFGASCFSSRSGERAQTTARNAPAPILGLAERVAYRAITDRVLRNEEEVDRSSDAYLDFVRAPVDFVLSKAAGERQLQRLLNDEEVRYVVKSDIAAFYQYIDHGILGRLLASRSDDVDLVQVLIELLGAAEGQSYGVPQTFASSDRVSELYGQLLEDQMLRRGHLLWRYNDDFRLGVASFAEALDAIEALSVEARGLGLILNEQKTMAPKFLTYAMSVFDLEGLDSDIPLEEQIEVEATIAAYGDTLQDPDDAVSLLLRAVDEDDDEWDLHNVGHDEVGRLRRALWSLVRNPDERALDALTPLVIYVPSLTPVLCRYAQAAATEHTDRVAAQIDDIVARVSLGSWQRLWFCNLIRSTGLVGDDAGGEIGERNAFLRKATIDQNHPAVRAEASLALAGAEGFTTEVSVGKLITEPSALASWYIAAAVQASHTARDERVLAGIRGSSQLHAMILDSLT